MTFVRSKLLLQVLGTDSVNQTFIDKYEIICTLGRGSMGVVYKAKDPEIGRLVAIKTLKSVFMGDDPAGNEALQRFRQESRSAGRLHHPNIVTIFEAGRSENGSPYIVMEYIEGKSIETLLKETGAFDPVQALHYLAQISNAVDYAHSQSVIHRDIKPSNIIVDGRHRPFLLDFGVAKLSDTSLTPAGTVVGTPSYMSPEQIRGAHLDGRTDIFSLAVVTFEIFTGTRPFPGSDFTTVVSNIIHKEPLSFSELGCTLPAQLEEAFRRGLSKDRDQRFQSAMEFIEAVAKSLSVVVDGTGIAGGYTSGLKLADAQARDFGVRTRAETVVGTFYPHSLIQGEAGAGVAASALEGSTGAAVVMSADAAQSAAPAAEQKFHVNGQNGADASQSRAAAPSAPAPASAAPAAPARVSLAAQAASAKAGGVNQTVVTDEKSALRVEPRSSGKSLKLIKLIGGVALIAALTVGGMYVMQSGSGDKEGSDTGEDDGGEGIIVPAPVNPPVNPETAASAKSSAVPEGSSKANPVESTPVKTVPETENGSTTGEPDGPEEGDSPALGTSPRDTGKPEVAPTAAPVSPASSGGPAAGTADAELTPIPYTLSPLAREADVAILLDGQLLSLLQSALAERGSSEALRAVIAESGKRDRREISMTLARLLGHPDYKIRVDVVKALSRPYHLEIPETRARMIEALADDDFVVRGFLVKALARSNAPVAKAALQARLAVEKNATVSELLRKVLDAK